ncbi:MULTISPECIES: hypothetical protein [Pseudomonas]|uniref:hypothetical protein n=1 Tax=Pseudomonas TaxID=286 RepID=UPI0025809DF8|nr:MULTISPECIES: hypothetical protein [Pseudomonas]
MTEAEKKAAAIEQAAVALLSEAKAAGVDLTEIAAKARTGIIGNAMYTWVSDHGMKAEAGNAVDYLIGAVK